ncbi:MAG: SEC-C domain-containing protein [Deltaproteobacteria bacterium]|nr:SEC-C domain-containing protein [Deltaproteobacteria bacterium]
MVARSEWVGGRVPGPFFITAGEPYRPDVVMWLDADEDLVVGSNIVHPSAPASEIGDCLTAAMTKPKAGPPRRPTRVRVATEALAEAVREVAGTDIAVEVGPTPEIDHIIRLMAEHVGAESGEPASYLEAGRVSVETVAAFFTVAARLYRAAPWKLAWDSQVLALDVPAYGVQGVCLSIIGQLKESFGLLVFDSYEKYRAMERASTQHQESGKPLENLGTSMLALNFDRGADIPPPMRKEIGAHGWEVAGPEAYPRVMLTEPDVLARPLTDRDVRLATVAAEAVVAFVKKHDDIFDVWSPVPRSHEVSVEIGSEQVRARVTAPHPALEGEGDGDEDDDGGVERKLVNQLVRAFLAAEAQAGQPEPWLSLAGFVCESLYGYKLDYGDGEVDGFTAVAVEEYLLDYFPRKVTADEEIIQATPDILTRHFEWLGATGKLPQQKVESICKRIEAKRNSFVRRANDSSRFGMAKGFVTMMQAAGVDPSDEKAVGRFMANYNAQVAREMGPEAGHLPPLDEPSAPARAARPPRQRWTPRPGEPLPSPTSPCPCGSGKRYKKCCLVR